MKNLDRFIEQQLARQQVADADSVRDDFGAGRPYPDPQAAPVIKPWMEAAAKASAEYIANSINGPLLELPVDVFDRFREEFDQQQNRIVHNIAGYIARHAPADKLHDSGLLKTKALAAKVQP